MPIPLGEIVAAVLHDEDGNPIDSVLDGTTRRLAVDAGSITAIGTTGDFDSAAEDETQETQLVRAALSGLDTSQSASSRNLPIRAIEEEDGSVPAFLVGIDGRESGFHASRLGRRFNVTTPAGTAVTGTTSFTATSPQILVQAGATNDLILRNLTIWIETAAGDDPVRIHIVIDPDARYSSGGTSRTAANMNTADATAFSAAQVRDGGITATATDGDERDVLEAIMTNSIGTGLSIDFKDGIIIAAGDTVLVYVEGATTAPDFTYSLEAEDVNAQ